MNIHIDSIAAQRIQTFVVPITHFASPNYNITASAPVRHLVTSGTTVLNKEDKPVQIKLNGGSFRQVDLTGKVTLSGKTTINRLVLRMGDRYGSPSSYTANVNVEGTINHLESAFKDAQVILGKSTTVQHAMTLDTSQLINGEYGLIRGPLPSHTKITRGREMNTSEQQISSWTSQLMTTSVNDKTVKQWFTQLGLKYVNDDYLPSYSLALTENANSTATRVQMGTVASWQQLVQHVNQILDTKTVNEAFVLNDNDLTIVRHDRVLRNLKSTVTDSYQSEMIALVGPDGQFEEVSFKRTYYNAGLSRFGVPDMHESYPFSRAFKKPGIYYHASIVNNNLHLIQVEVASVDQRLGITKVNGKTLSTYNATPPKIEVKIVKPYLLIRSNDKEWLSRAAFIATKYEPSQLILGNLNEAGDWNKGTYVAALGNDFYKGGSVRIRAYGYKDAIVRIP